MKITIKEGDSVELIKHPDQENDKDWKRWFATADLKVGNVYTVVDVVMCTDDIGLELIGLELKNATTCVWPIEWFKISSK